MAETLLAIFKIIEDKTGFKGRMRLAVMTGINRVKASEIPDDPKTVDKFKRAASEILGQDIDDKEIKRLVKTGLR
ncbi:MAG: hypothetical protein QXD02_04810 [Candidatus Parvarchaeum sp.]|nr:hypothetical protein [Candidatus Parvarchaeum tengchongense]